MSAKAIDLFATVKATRWLLFEWHPSAFEGGHAKTADAGDGDFLTADTLWDFKAPSREPTSKNTLQLLLSFNQVYKSLTFSNKLICFAPPDPLQKSNTQQLAVGSYSTFAWYSVKTSISVSSQTISISTAKPDMGELTLSEARLLAPAVASPVLTVNNGAFTDLNTKLSEAGFRFLALSTVGGQRFATQVGGVYSEASNGFIQILIKAHYSGMKKWNTNIEADLGILKDANGTDQPNWLRMQVAQYTTSELTAKCQTKVGSSTSEDGVIFANGYPATAKGYDLNIQASSLRLQTLDNNLLCGQTAVTTISKGVDSGVTYYVISFCLEGTVGNNQENLPEQNIIFSVSLTAEKK